MKDREILMRTLDIIGEVIGQLNEVAKEKKASKTRAHVPPHMVERRVQRLAILSTKHDDLVTEVEAETSKTAE